MGALHWLLGRRSFGHGVRNSEDPRHAVLYEGSEDLDVAGESHYQAELWRIVGGWTDKAVRHPIVAVLRPEPDNPYDRNAIAVHIAGYLVGYLRREVAAEYLPGLLALQAREGRPIALSGVIAGGGRRPDGPGMLGVFLSHDPSDFGIAIQPNSGIGVREGTSAEWADGHLEWMSHLPDEDGAAIVSLRRWLGTVSDPVERHFLYLQLEKRLYRGRIDGSLLNEFDAVCVAHDAEMDSIRPALIVDFGAVPHLTTYHQMAIRAAKAHRWEVASLWAERGLARYGSEAASTEWPLDLMNRVESYRSKLHASQSTTHATASRPARAPAKMAVAEEALVCERCGVTFTRPRTVGRKPRQCPECRLAVVELDGST